MPVQHDPERCRCRECLELDLLPAWRQGILGTFQFDLLSARPNMITATEFARIVRLVREAGYGDDIEWAQNCKPPADADQFAREAIFVICNSGMRFTVARGIFDRVMACLKARKSARAAFGHVGKCEAIDDVWANREEWYRRYMAAEDKVDFCGALPWIGRITKYHLAKNFGAQVAKPDVHLQRLADREGVTVQQLCERLAEETGLKVPTVDTVLWRACAIGIINSRA